MENKIESKILIYCAKLNNPPIKLLNMEINKIFG